MKSGWEKVDPMVAEAVGAFAEQAVRMHPGCAVYLFGSQAKGCARPGSDIDVAVVVAEVEGSASDPWRSMAAADELSLAASLIDYGIEPHLIESMHDRAGFLSVVVETGLRVA